MMTSKMPNPEDGDEMQMNNLIESGPSPEKVTVTTVDEDSDDVSSSNSCFSIFCAHQGLLLTILSAMSFALWASIAKLLTTSINVLQVIVMTTPIAAMCSIVLIVIKGLGPPKEIPTYFWILAFVVAICIKNVSTFWAYDFIEVADVITIGQSSVVIVALLSYIMLKEPPKILDLLFGTLAVFGVVIISRPSFIFSSEDDSSASSRNSLPGIILSLISAFMIAICYIFIRKMSSLGVHPFVSSGFNSLFSCLFTTLLCSALQYWKCPTVRELLLTIAMGLVYFAGQLTMFYALAKENATTVSVVYTSKVAFGFIWQFALFNIAPMWTSVCGALLVIAACIGTLLRKYCATIRESQSKKSEDRRE